MLPDKTRQHWESGWASEDSIGTTYATYFINKADLFNKRVLEIGCGDNLTNLHLDSSYIGKGRYAGIDLSLNALLKAKQIWKNRNFIQADSSTLPFSENSFDSIISIQTIAALGIHAENVLHEAARVLSKNGTLLFDVNHSDYYARDPVKFKLHPFNHGRLIKNSRLPDGLMTYDETGVKALMDSMGLVIEWIDIMNWYDFSNMGASGYERWSRQEGDEYKCEMLIKALRK